MHEISGSRIDLAYYLFFKALVQGGIKPLANAAYDLLHWPVAITDHISNSLCQVPNEKIGIPDWDELIEQRSSRPEHYLDFYEKYLSNPETHHYPLIINDGYLSKTRQIITTFFVRGKPAGYVVIHIAECEVADEDIEIVNILSSALSAEVTKSEERERFYNKRNLLRLKNALSGNPGSPAIIKDIEALEKELPKGYLLIVSRFSGNNNDERILELASNDIMKNHSNVLSINTEDHVVVTICGSVPKNGIPSELVSSVLNTLSKYTMSSGITATFHSLLQIKAFYQQALLSLRLGYHINPEKMVYSFEECAPLHLFVPAVDAYPLETFLHPLILNIDHYDQKNNTDYLRTLEAYILSSQNTGSAAKTLSVHHNTLLYRINRIKELFDIDFKDSNLVITLLCNFLLMKAGNILNDNNIGNLLS